MTYGQGMTDTANPVRLDRQRSIYALVRAVGFTDAYRQSDGAIVHVEEVASFVSVLDEDAEPLTVRTVEMRVSDWVDMGRPTTITVTIEPGDALNDLAGARDRVKRAEGDVVEQVREARRNGKSWHDIGKVFGISRQAAWEAYAHKIGDEVTLR